jgi:hypothetical protein
MIEMEALCKELGLKFFVSDAHHKERCAWGSCCGLPQGGKFDNFAKCQFTQAIIVAKEKGEVKFSDISELGHDYLDNVTYGGAWGLNGGTMLNEAKNRFKSLYDFVRTVWNNPKRKSSPFYYFDRILIPDRLDENGDMVYRFNQRKYEGKR